MTEPTRSTGSTAKSYPAVPVLRTSTQHYERVEYHLLSKLVEFHVPAVNLLAVQEAVAAAITEVRELGLNVADVPLNYRVTGPAAETGVVSYEVERDDPGLASPPADEHGFVGIVAVLPRNWPQQLQRAVNRAAIEPGRIEDVMRLVDEWVSMAHGSA